ncbi:MAG: Mg-chelatase subunit ChlD [Bacteroidia bacterium]|jgi:Mg-chelatase subunit ChlD
MLGSLTALPQAKVKWDNTKFDLGTVKDWDSPEAIFTYRCSGRGSTMFLPQKYQQDLQVNVPAGTVRPGDVGTITIKYFTNQTGSFKRTVNLYHSASQEPVRITISGNIKSIKHDALTACPRFGPGSRPATSTHKNVVIAVDRITGNPLSNVSLKLLEEGDAKIQTRTSPKGRSTHKIGIGKYRIYATKDGYHPTAAEVIFDRGHATHWIYMDPIGNGEERKEKSEKSIDEQQESEPVILSDSRWDEPKKVESDELIVDNDDGVFDMGVTLNDQWDESEIASSSEDRWAEPEEVASDELIVASEPEPFDLGITTNDRWGETERKSENERSELSTETSDGQIEEIAISTVEKQDEPDPNEMEPQVEPANSSILEPQTSTEPEFSEKSYRQNNLVLLLDVSASMKKEDKMIKLKSTITRVVEMLRDVDVLTIIAYNIKSWEVLPPTPVTDNEMIISMIDTLTPFGYTNGVRGMEQAYSSLRDQFIQGGNNQLILATDGKFNSSKFSEKDALNMVKTKAGGGSVLSIIGFGEDKDATRMMKKMAKAGEGSFIQIGRGDDPTELLADEIKLRSRKK